MSQTIKHEHMKCGQAYRLVNTNGPSEAKKYIGKLFIAGSTDVSKARIDNATCFEDGFSFYGFLEGTAWEKANAKVIELDSNPAEQGAEEEEALPF